MKYENRNVFVGDNLGVMKGMDEGFVDLIYLDPPFNSSKRYKAPKGRKAEGSEFDDVWKSMDEYLNFMKVRLVEIRRILKSSGCIYLHCDTNASHYLKVLMDDIFGSDRFINEVIWGYKWGGVGKRSFARKHDVIFLYSKGEEYTFNDDVVREEYTTKDERWHNNKKGKIMRDIWDDIPIINTQAKERTGYPTQKPVALLERIIKASSNEGDLVLDPFCGSGTTLVASENLKRRWIGIDSNNSVKDVVKGRLNGVSFIEV